MISKHNFIICNADTDSIMFCKPDQSFITEEEEKSLLSEINSLLPKMIKYDTEGVFKKAIILKAKNYLLVDKNGKIKIKGSSLKSSTLEPALKTMINKILDVIIKTDDINSAHETLQAIYLEYVKEVKTGFKNKKDWAKKMMLSPTTFNSTRKNEKDVVNAISGTEYKSGDKIYVYRNNEGNLTLIEKFNNDYDKKAYYKKLYSAILRFETILPVKTLFLNFNLKRNERELQNL